MMQSSDTIPNMFSASDLLMLKVEHFIFHEIRTEADGPLLLDRVELTQHQTGFFIERFADAARHLTEYEFTDAGISNIATRMHDLLDHPPENFVSVSQDLATSFHHHHKGQMADGIMVVAFAMLDRVPLLIILKLDHREVLRYQVEDNAHGKSAVFQHVPNTVVQGREALQKMAIVDLSDHYEWDVLAMDRTTNGQRVSQYFEQFLNMRQMETPVMVMQNTLTDVHQWAVAQSSNLDPEQHITDYKERAIQYMDMNSNFETSEFLDFVVQDQNTSRKEALRDTLYAELASSGLDRKSFVPRPELLGKGHRKHQLKTHEGVRLEWFGSLDQNGIEISEPKVPGGQFEIRIRTSDMDVFS